MCAATKLLVNGLYRQITLRSGPPVHPAPLSGFASLCAQQKNQPLRGKATAEECQSHHRGSRNHILTITDGWDMFRRRNPSRTGQAGSWRLYLSDIMSNYVKRDNILQEALLLLGWEGRAMENRRYSFIDRRQDSKMPATPFKDRNGETVKTNRRKVANRRLDDIELDYFDDLVIR